ncbi:MAG: BT_3928 family protein [Gilvibacter sp.]
MRNLVGFSRIFVGIFFIISGFIKLNDPVGFSFKLKDYFAPEVLNLEFLVPYALLIAVVIVIYEVILGVMIIIGYARKFTVWSLLLMIVFFTFLTFYSAYTGKVTDCGCFGDALKLTPWESFWKDVGLLILILILFIGQKHLWPFFSKTMTRVIVLVSFIASMVFCYYVLQHLPWIDFRPYKIGANIQEEMSVPEGAPQPIYEYAWKFNIDGEEQVITTNGDYPDVDGELVGYETKLIQEGYEPPIHDFTIEKDGEDMAAEWLEEEHLVVVVAYSLRNTENEGYGNIRAITNKALKNGYKVIGWSASSEEETEALKEKHDLNFDFYFCDETTLKTIVRSNPSVLELSKGTILQKLHWNDALDLELKTLEGAMPELDFTIKRRLDSIAVLDQRYRTLIMASSDEEREKIGKEMGLEAADYTGDLWAKQIAIDTSNLKYVESLLAKGKYPGKSMVGEPTNMAAWYVIQHNPDRIPMHLDMMKAAGKNGELPFTAVAMMEDRYLMNQGKEQEYGTQGMSYNDDRGSFIWPIRDAANVNKRRAEAGFTRTLEEYAIALYGPDFVYEPLTLDQVKQE